jgi:hypothetical protein
MKNEAIEAARPDGSILRIEFVWHVDRFMHRISAASAAGVVLSLLESVEGTPADDWPASPPLHSLSITELALGRRAALLVGMAGRSHWSASIEALPGAAEILFDLACRHSDLPQWLGSRYRVPPGGAGRFTVEPQGSRVASDDRAGLITVEPLPALGRSGTARWKYCVKAVR